MGSKLTQLTYCLIMLHLPALALAGEGPAGHHHDHQAVEKPENPVHDHGDAAKQADPHQEHDHAAHTWKAPDEEMKRPNPVPATEKSITTGQRIFRHYCIACHGYEADGTGMHGQNLNPKAANLRAMAGHHSDGDYHYKIRTGHGPMPHWEKTISATNIWHLVNYLQSLKPAAADSAEQNPHSHHQPAKDAHDHSSHKH